jgi:hypothetical protein
MVAAALAALTAVGSGCGSSGAQASASPGASRQLFSLVGFDLRSGHPCRVSFTVDAPTLRIVAYVRGRGPAPGADPVLTCRLEKVDGSRLVPVGLKAHEQASGQYWIYAAQATGPLAVGTYRLTMTGDGIVRPFSAAQL